MRYLILTLGTRGDWELFRTLGLALAARGHEVTIASSPFYADALSGTGLQFLPVGDSTQDNAIDALRRAGESDDLVERTRQFYESWLRPQLNQALVTLSRVAGSFDAFISNLKLVLKRGGEILPGVSVTYDPPLQLADLPRYGPPRNEVLDLVALDRRLVDPEGRWDARFQFTGFWTPREPDKETALPEALARFLDAGPAPVVFTLGSMAFESPERILTVIRDALSRCEQRGVIVGGWSRFPRQSSDEQLFIVDEAPYERLFPRGAAIVHHGGVGTVAAALRAGRPSVILPQVACQNVFANLLARAELSAGTLAPRELNAERLAMLMESAIHDPRLQQSALVWSETLRDERGADRAAELIEAHAENLRRG